MCACRCAIFATGLKLLRGMSQLMLDCYDLGHKVDEDKGVRLMKKVFYVVDDPEGDGDHGQHVNITGAGIVASTDKYDTAVAFLEWLSEPTAQQIYSSTNYEYPVNPTVAHDAEMTSWGAFRADELPVQSLSEHAPTAQRIINITGW